MLFFAFKYIFIILLSSAWWAINYLREKYFVFCFWREMNQKEYVDKVENQLTNQENNNINNYDDENNLSASRDGLVMDMKAYKYRGKHLRTALFIVVVALVILATLIWTLKPTNKKEDRSENKQENHHHERTNRSASILKGLTRK